MEQEQKGEIETFSPPEQDRIVQYQRMLHLVDSASRDLQDRNPTVFVYKYADEKQPPRYMYTIDECFIEGMQHAAENLKKKYSASPHMKRAFENIDEAYRIEKETEEAYQIRDCEKMWENGMPVYDDPNNY